MHRQLIRRKISSLRRGPNARKLLGSEADARALWRSYKKQPLHPLLISLPDLIRDGARRHWGAELEGDGDCEVDCLIVEGNPTEAQITTLQLVSAVHRADLSPYDKAVAIRDIKAAHPGMTNKHLADDFLDMDPSQVPKYLSLFDCIPAVQEAAQAGGIGLSDWYKLSGLPPDQQRRMLAARLRGEIKSRADLNEEARKQQNGHADQAKVPSIKITLSNDFTVTVRGKDLTLARTGDLLKAASKEVEFAKTEKLNARTAQSAWKDRAAKAKDAKKPEEPIFTETAAVANGEE